MKRTLAHVLRRVARALIGWSTKLDPAHIAGVYESPQLGVNFVEPWSVQYAGQAAGMAVPGLMETFDTGGWQSRIVNGLAGARPALPNQGAHVRRSRITRLMDWLEQTDWGYGLGILTMVAASVIALFGAPWWWISAPLVIVAFALCWWFG